MISFPLYYNLPANNLYIPKWYPDKTVIMRDIVRVLLSLQSSGIWILNTTIQGENLALEKVSGIVGAQRKGDSWTWVF